MSYEPTNWKSGDVVTSAKLNKLEQGVADASGGGVLVVNLIESNGVITADKTMREIIAAMPMVVAKQEYEYEGENGTMYAWSEGWGALPEGSSDGAYRVHLGDYYFCNSLDEYPSKSSSA